MKSGNLNFLEPSGPLQACNGTALPLPLFLYLYLRCKVYFCLVTNYKSLLCRNTRLCSPVITHHRTALPLALCCVVQYLRALTAIRHPFPEMGVDNEI